jgi:rhomboid protease GluP
MYDPPPTRPPSAYDDLDEAEDARSVEVPLPQGRAPFTKVVIGVMAVVFVLDLLARGALTEWGLKSNPQILLQGEYYRLFTLMFLHAGLLHLAVNGYALWYIGQEVERFYGSLRMAIVFFVGGLTGSVASLALTEDNAVGASGAVFAVFAAEMVLLVTNRRLFGDQARQRLQYLVLLLLLNAGIGLAAGGAIDNWAHLGGFVGGAVVSWALAPRYRVAVAPGGLGAVSLQELEAGPRPALAVGAWLVVLVLTVAWLTVLWRS